MKISKFVFESPYPIVIKSNQFKGVPDTLDFYERDRLIATDDHYGLEFLTPEDVLYTATYDSSVALDLKCKVNRVHMSLAKHAMQQAILWLCDRFPEPQVLPIKELPYGVVVRSINLHYEGGWNKLVQDCLES